MRGFASASLLNRPPWPPAICCQCVDSLQGDLFIRGAQIGTTTTQLVSKRNPRIWHHTLRFMSKCKDSVLMRLQLMDSARRTGARRRAMAQSMDEPQQQYHGHLVVCTYENPWARYGLATYPLLFVAVILRILSISQPQIPRLGTRLVKSDDALATASVACWDTAVDVFVRITGEAVPRCALRPTYYPASLPRHFCAVHVFAKSTYGQANADESMQGKVCKE